MAIQPRRPKRKFDPTKFQRWRKERDEHDRWLAQPGVAAAQAEWAELGFVDRLPRGTGIVEEECGHDYPPWETAADQGRKR